MLQVSTKSLSQCSGVEERIVFMLRRGDRLRSIMEALNISEYAVTKVRDQTQALLWPSAAIDWREVMVMTLIGYKPREISVLLGISATYVRTGLCKMHIRRPEIAAILAETSPHQSEPVIEAIAAGRSFSVIGSRREIRKFKS